MARWWPTAIQPWDNPATVRVRKYLTGTNLLLEVVDVEPGRSPKEIVWTDGEVRLYRYRPLVDRRFAVPVVLVYALILRPYILDLVPRSSLVETLLGQGFDVYLLDFGAPGPDDRHRGLDDYVLGCLPSALAATRRASHASSITLLGHCMGGTLSACYAAHPAGSDVENLVLLAAPVDFTPAGPLWTRWVGHLDPVPLVRFFGNLPARALSCLPGVGVAQWGRLLRPVGEWFLAGPPFFGDRRAAEEWLAVCRWVDDGVPFAGQAFVEWISNFYHHNALVRGELCLAGERIDLARLTCPILAVAGTLDAVTPFPQARAGFDLVGSEDRELFVLDGGHLGLLLGPPGRNELWPRLVDWLARRSGAVENARG